MKRIWIILLALLAVIVLPVTVLYHIPSGDGSSELYKMDTMFYEAVRAYENRESVEVHWTLTEVTKDGEAVKCDAMLWRHGENWLQETVVTTENGPLMTTELQYGDLYFTEAGVVVTCTEQKLEGIGQVSYEGFDTYDKREDGTYVIYLERTAAEEEKQRGLYQRKSTMEFDPKGNLVYVLTQDYYLNQKGHLAKETEILSWDTAACEEKISEAYERLRSAAE